MAQRRITQHLSKTGKIMPREKLILQGEQALTDEELLAILLRTGLQGCDVFALSSQLLAHFGSLNSLSRASALEMIDAVKGMGVQKATTLAAAFLLGRRALNVPLGSHFDFDQWKDYWRQKLAGESRELIIAAMLDRQGKTLGEEVLSYGGLRGASLDLSHLLRLMVRRGAYYLVLGHNHPSGNPTASNEDHTLTDFVSERLKVLDMQLFDHVIFAGDKCVSLKK